MIIYNYIRVNNKLSSFYNESGSIFEIIFIKLTITFNNHLLSI